VEHYLEIKNIIEHLYFIMEQNLIIQIEDLGFY